MVGLLFSNGKCTIKVSSFVGIESSYFHITELPLVNKRKGIFYDSKGKTFLYV